jgi:4-hydroxy-tetrahydrodipicolinate synthase
MTTFKGVIPILATPFSADESVDFQSWTRLIEFMLELGVDGVTILGVLGESNRLADHERAELIKAAVGTVRGRVPVIVGTSHSGTRVTEYLSQMAQDLGADAVMVTPAKEPVPSDERIIETFQRLGAALTIPIVLQDHPASSEVHLRVPLIHSLLQSVPRIQCIKEEAVPTAAKIRALRQGPGTQGRSIVTGLGALYGPFDLEAGSDGFNTGFAFPEALVALMGAARAGDWPLVYRIYSHFAALIVFEQQPGVAIRKELLRRRGLLTTASARHPGVSISASASSQLDTLLARTLPEVNITKPIDVAAVLNAGVQVQAR